MSASAQAASERGGETSLKLHRSLVGAEVGAAAAEERQNIPLQPRHPLQGGCCGCRTGHLGAIIFL